MPRKLKLPEGFPPLTLKIVRKRNFRHLKMRFVENATLIVNLPNYVSLKICEEFIATNLQWILTQFEKSKQAQDSLRNEQFYLFGEWVEFEALKIYLDKKFIISLQKVLQKWDSTLEGANESLLLRKLWQVATQGEALYIQDSVRIKLKSFLVALYQKALESYASPRLEEIAQTMQLFPHRVSYGKSYRQLGCCQSKRQSIRLSLRLALMPLICVDSVIIHELAHLHYPNHRQDFWNLVRKFDKNPKSVEEWLLIHYSLNRQLYQCIFK